MAVAPLTNIYTPAMEDLKKMIGAVALYTSAGATTEVTVTLDNSYPPINRSSICKILY